MAPSCLLSLFAASAFGHGTIISPAVRANPSVNHGDCPWCSGNEKRCADDGVLNDADCLPPSPCWGAPGPTTVSPEKFTWIGEKRHPDRTYWVDQNGGSTARPLWCPGDIVPIRYYVHQDHNGVWFWEYQPASPGQEVERRFTRITNHTSINNYVKNGLQLANYFAVEDGTTQIPAGYCKDGTVWSWQRDSCMNGMFAETNLTLPYDLPPGETVFRWRWFGAMNQSGKFVVDSKAERSLFVSCKDVIVGTREQCASRMNQLFV